MARNSQFLYADTLAALASQATCWLDLGCGHQFVPDWVPADALSPQAARTTVVGVDGDLRSLRSHPGLTMKVAADIERLPLAASTFDLVTANMVVEHVADPHRLFGEVARVLMPGGRFLVHTPNVHGYTTTLARLIPSSLRPGVAGMLQGRRAEDVYPTHYRANSAGALGELAARHGFQIERLDTINSSAQLFRVPIAGWLEDRWLQLLSARALARLRPCILAVFTRTA